MEIKQNLTNVNYNSANKVNKYIVIHYTGNSTDTAYNNTRYFKSENRNASANYFVDDNDIYQCVLDKDIAWHCGGGRQSSNGGSFYGICTNSNSIGVEMCCTNYDVSAKTEANTIELVKYLMNKYNIPVSNVIRHYDVNGKNCPAPMVSNSARWNNFKTKLNGSTPQSTPSTGNNITYQIWDDVKNKWLPNVVNDSDYAGIYGHDVCCVYANMSKGNVYYKVHYKGGKWLPEVKNRTDYAGLYNKPIDGFMIKSDSKNLSYRVHLRRQNRWLPWVTGYNQNDSNNGYAGIMGQEIDGIQIK